MLKEDRDCGVGTGDWIDREVAACEFADVRLGRRFRDLLEQLGEAVGESIPMACQDWANTKAAYRFFSNERVSEADILSGHFQATHDRFATSGSLVMVLHDTTEFSYPRVRPELVGFTKAINSGHDKAGRLRTHTVCGVMMHSSLAVTSEGLPLGLAAIKFWSRKKFKGTKALKRKINPTKSTARRNGLRECRECRARGHSAKANVGIEVSGYRCRAPRGRRGRHARKE
jgi:hypothetical protein